MKTPYTYWSREELYNNLINQFIGYKSTYTEKEIKEAVFSDEWDPIIEFNGCNLVEDELHPFLPCFIHDYDWIVKGGGNTVDIKFRNNLRLYGFSRLKANIYYLAVRIGWLFYFQFTK